MKIRIGLTILMAAILAGCATYPDGEDHRMIAPGATVSGVISLGPESPRYETYRIEVPTDAFGIRIYLSESPADLDIFIKYNEEIFSYNDVSSASTLDDYNENLFFSRMDDPPLQAGVYYVDVTHGSDIFPRQDGRILYEAPFKLTYEVIPIEVTGVLTPNARLTSTLHPDEGMTRIFTIEVPENTDAFRVDLFDNNGDIDLLVNRERPAWNPEEADRFAVFYRSKESVVWRSYPDEPLIPGLYYVTVLDMNNDAPEDFSITASLSEEPADFLKELPFLTVPEDLMERSLLSTIEIITEMGFRMSGQGTGCLVSAGGLVLTNWHVIRGSSGGPAEKIYGAVTLDPAVPAVEMFQMDVVEYDEVKDIALLRISRGFYGQDLPSEYRFPYYELGDPESLEVGHPLVIIGYPTIGGTGSRPSINITRGIVSGFEKTFFGKLIKTDAEISKGNSGGAVINAVHELIGLPTSIAVAKENAVSAGQMNYIHPVTLLPRDWVTMIESD